MRPGFGKSAGGAIELAFEPADEYRASLGFERLAAVLRRHHAGAQLTDDLFPHVGVRGDGHEILRFERKVSGAFEIVMAVETILRNDGPVVRGKLLGRRRAARQHERGAEAYARYDRECSRQTAPRIATPHDLANVATQRAAVDCWSVVAHIPTTGEGPFAVRQRYGNDVERIRTSARSLEVEWLSAVADAIRGARRSIASSRFDIGVFSGKARWSTALQFARGAAS